MVLATTTGDIIVSSDSINHLLLSTSVTKNLFPSNSIAQASGVVRDVPIVNLSGEDPAAAAPAHKVI